MSIAEEMIFCLVHEIVDDIFADGEEEAPASALPAVSAVVRPQDTKKDEDDEASAMAESTPEVDVADAAVYGPPASKRPRRGRRLGVSSGAHDQIVLLR